jgi:hypothetical protein
VRERGSQCAGESQRVRETACERWIEGVRETVRACCAVLVAASIACVSRSDVHGSVAAGGTCAMPPRSECVG